MVWEVLREQQPAPQPRHASVCLIVRAEAKAGQEERVEKLLREFAYQVRNEELGCDSYTVTRMIGSDNFFAAHARFIDFEAFRAHGETDHMHSIMARLSPHLATPFAMEIYSEV
jgi:quinol monooxygenase YgiN